MSVRNWVIDRCGDLIDREYVIIIIGVVIVAIILGFFGYKGGMEFVIFLLMTPITIA